MGTRRTCVQMFDLFDLNLWSPHSTALHQKVPGQQPTGLTMLRLRLNLCAHTKPQQIGNSRLGWVWRAMTVNQTREQMLQRSSSRQQQKHRYATQMVSIEPLQPHVGRSNTIDVHCIYKLRVGSTSVRFFGPAAAEVSRVRVRWCFLLGKYILYVCVHEYT